MHATSSVSVEILPVISDDNGGKCMRDILRLTDVKRRSTGGKRVSTWSRKIFPCVYDYVKGSMYLY